MTQEQKAKAYDEAIKKAKDFKEGVIHYELKIGENIMDYIFPELKESEDERIREELIDAIQGLWENDSATWPSSLEKKNKYIAWLEKQGEQILANSTKTCKNEQKPAWSAEDEKCLENAIMYCEWARDKALNLPCYETSEKSISWLKSLRLQNTWKPSDEQMIALRQVISGCSYDIEPLLELETKLNELLSNK